MIGTFWEENVFGVDRDRFLLIISLEEDYDDGSPYKNGLGFTYVENTGRIGWISATALYKHYKQQ